MRLAKTIVLSFLTLAGCANPPVLQLPSDECEVIAMLKEGVTREPEVGQIINRFEMGKKYLVIRLLPGESLKTLRADPGVEVALPNRPLPKMGQPDDPLLSLQWAFERIKPQPCWDRLIDASKVTVAVLDTGIDYEHPDLAGRVIKGFNFADNNEDVMDREGHGTHVAGIIGAAGNNEKGVCGVLWNVRLLAVKVLNQDGGNDASALAGIRYAVDHGARVINLSFNSNNTSVNPLYATALEYARKQGALVVAAAGNNGGEVTYPANTPGCLTVSATGNFRHWEWLSPFSNRGESVTYSAPGAAILSTVPKGGYESYSGTSMAAPFVTGAIATLMALHPDWNLDQIENRLAAATDDLGDPGRDPLYGIGRINLSKLLDP